MDEETIGQRVKRNRSSRCPQCDQQFTSRKARHTHQMAAHRKHMKRKPPVMVGKRLVPAKDLYG